MNNSQLVAERVSGGSGLYVSRGPHAVPHESTTPSIPAPHDSLFNGSLNRTPTRLPAAPARSPYSGGSHETVGLPMMATKTPAERAPGEATVEGNLLEVLLPVTARIGEKPEARQSLGLTIRTVASSPHSTARVLCLRVTDPSDPFLLFELELREEDYAAFRERLELRVDFLAFPKYLVTLFEAIANSASPCHVSFIVGSQDGGKGVLRILELTEFKTVEHVSLLLLRQGDVGQKRHLAERFRFFEQAYHQAVEDNESQERHYTQCVSELQQQLAELTEENGRLRDDMKLSKSVSEKNHVTALAEARAAHDHELQRVREKLLSELQALREESTRSQTRLTDDMRAKDDEIRRLRDANRELEGSQAALKAKLALTEDKVAALDTEVKSLRETNTELTHFKVESTRAMSENELNYVSVTERLRAATKALTDKDDELRSLREHYQKQDDYIRMLSSQNEQLQERCAASDKSLDKSHHIIAHQIETIKSIKERCRAASDQVTSKEALLQERQLAAQRVKDELATCTDRVNTLQRQNNDLKAQLQRTDAAQEQLSQELKQSQMALLHLQRSTSVNGRHWGVFSSSAPPVSGGVGSAAPSSVSPSAGLYSQFSRHATLHGQYSSPPVAVSPAGTGDGPVPSPAVSLFRSSHGTAGGDTAGLTATVAQSATAQHMPGTDGALKPRSAEGANRTVSKTLGAKDALRAKSFFTEDSGAAAATEPRSAYF